MQGLPWICSCLMTYVPWLMRDITWSLQSLPDEQETLAESQTLMCAWLA